ncbi:TlpA disulfide reductase family protein [Filimonas effusa]|uniref:TlpA family protein disulfide reductase n=1 Tax=Filimonas effusa TaxID=2508721 RepID=A0A4Q1D7E9_9BACT|nr:TlpA disulfide reductase family protein [Filimonas effusa]RXK83617.1 TlpA family protein disulfide reductase [Filimonas effusa]
MSTKKWMIPALAAAFTATNANAQGIVKYTPARVTGGDSVSIYYNPENSILKGLAPVTGVIYLYRNNDWEAHDLSMRMTDSGWIARYLVPVGTTLVIPNFSANGKTDKGGVTTYASVAFDKSGRQMPMSLAAWGFLRTPVLKEQTPPARTDSAVIKPEVSLFWMNNELRDHPESRRKIFFNAMAILQKANPGKLDSILPREIKFISSLPDATEQELMDISKAYRRLMGKPALADSMDKVIMAKFPNGVTARDKEIYKIFRATQQERAELWNSFVQRFPLDSFRNVNTEAEQMWYDKNYRAVVYSEMINKNYAFLKKMIPAAPLTSQTEFHRLLVMGPYEHGEVTADFILPYSKMLVEHIEYRSLHKDGAESRFYAPSQWEQFVLGCATPAFFGHASLLHQVGKDKESLVWVEKVKGQPAAQNAAFQGLYAILLENNGRHSDAIQVVENSVALNSVTPEAIELLKKEYIKKNGSDKGFEAYFNGLKNEDKLNEQRAHIRQQMLNKVAPGFKLEQLKGGFADLSRMKGHIVVIDFWATWCGPCKAALPGMQMAVNKYAKDDKVDFFFVATQETKPDYKEQIKAFLKANNYNLNVLYDGKSANGHLDQAYSKYASTVHSSGIPAKFIIDGKGQIRWYSAGYFGSPSALADEISYIIELLKKEG